MNGQNRKILQNIGAINTDGFHEQRPSTIVECEVYCHNRGVLPLQNGDFEANQKQTHMVPGTILLFR